MPVATLILLGSAFLLPAAGLIALRWAGREGQLGRFDKAALLPFEETEPVGLETDRVLGGHDR
jgi:hypothetical protein